MSAESAYLPPSLTFEPDYSTDLQMVQLWPVLFTESQVCVTGDFPLKIIFFLSCLTCMISKTVGGANFPVGCH